MRFFNITFTLWLVYPSLGHSAPAPSSPEVSKKLSINLAVKSSAGISFYLKELQKARQNIRYENYEQVVYQKICPYLKDIKSMELKNQELDQNTRIKIVTEAVKIYNKALDFSEEHYLMYCLYNYYENAHSDEVFRISKKFLPLKKQKQFKDMWALCDRETKEGNGDQVNTPLEQPYLLLPEENYKAMSEGLQLSYIKKVKKAFFNLENTATNPVLSAEQKTGSFLKFLNFFFIKYSQADLGVELKDKCLIGGQIRDRIYSHKLRRTVCPTKNNTCGEAKNSFKCGPIFNNKCIAYHPVGTISKRCYKASINKPISPEDYKKYKSHFDKIVTEYCTGRRTRLASCIHFANRIKQINNLSNVTPEQKTALKRNIRPPKKAPRRQSNQEPQNLTSHEQTEADAPLCTDCETTNTETQKLKETVDQATKKSGQKPPQKGLVKYFVDTIFTNVSCECEKSNDGCTRGCLPKNQVDNDKSPPISQCVEDEKKTSRGVCMRYVTNAIMNTVHNLLAIHCNENKNSKDYYQCVSDDDHPRNICKHGFVLPSALCALNLDGQSDKDFKKIQNTEVRQKCKYHNKLNSSLYHFPVIQEDGSIKNIPLFKKMDPKQLKELQNDTSQIPEGAIIVTNSSNKNGHVEIKTDKKNCGEHQNQTCFCSDFCRERPKYQAPFIVQAVFQWNPEIIKYAKKPK